MFYSGLTSSVKCARTCVRVSTAACLKRNPVNFTTLRPFSAPALGTLMLQLLLLKHKNMQAFATSHRLCCQLLAWGTGAKHKKWIWLSGVGICFGAAALSFDINAVIMSASWSSVGFDNRNWVSDGAAYRFENKMCGSTEKNSSKSTLWHNLSNPHFPIVS